MTLVVNTKTTKTELTAEVRRLEQEAKDYKERVARIAFEAKDAEGWCDSGFREAMEELDLNHLLPSNERLVTITVIADAAEYGLPVEQMHADDWAEAAISKIRYASAGDLESYSVAEVPKDN